MIYNKLIGRRQRLASALPWDEERGSGRTTALALGFLATAINFRGNWVEIMDHEGTQRTNDQLADSIMRTAKALGLEFIERDSPPHRVAGLRVNRIRSNHFTNNQWEVV